MELLVIVLAIVLIAVLAPRFGYDSRERMQSNEEQLACLGMRWGDAAPVALRPVRASFRRRLARGLYALAEWLNPELGSPGLAR